MNEVWKHVIEDLSLLLGQEDQNDSEQEKNETEVLTDFRKVKKVPELFFRIEERNELTSTL